MFLANLFFLGSSEMLVILVVALIIFGPRKLPEISRTLGRSLSEFKRASEDFKRTWEREVELERTAQETRIERPALSDETERSIRPAITEHSSEQPLPIPVASETSIARGTASEPVATEPAAAVAVNETEPARKSDWL